MQLSSIVFLRAFPGNGGDTYRVDWFGDVNHTGRNGGHTPMAQIVISLWQLEDRRRTVGNHADRFTSISIPIAFLRLFRIGDLWSGGRQIGTDEEFVQETFENLEINDSTVTVAPAGLPLDLEAPAPLYPLPFSSFVAHCDHRRP